MRLPWTSIGMQQRSSLQLCSNPRTVVTLLFLLTACACEREERRFSEVAPMSSRPQPSMKTELRPGAPEAPVDEPPARPGKRRLLSPLFDPEQTRGKDGPEQ